MTNCVFERTATGSITKHTFNDQNGADALRTVEGFIEIDAEAAEAEMAQTIADAQSAEEAWNAMAAERRAEQESKRAAALQKLADAGLDIDALTTLFGEF